MKWLLVIPAALFGPALLPLALSCAILWAGGKACDVIFGKEVPR